MHQHIVLTMVEWHQGEPVQRTLIISRETSPDAYEGAADLIDQMLRLAPATPVGEVCDELAAVQQQVRRIQAGLGEVEGQPEVEGLRRRVEELTAALEQKGKELTRAQQVLADFRALSERLPEHD